MFQIETLSVYHYGTSMRTPLTYYGGKARIAKWVVSKFPPNYQNLHYVEPFCGGLSVFFEKEKSKAETVSDSDWKIYNFFYQLRYNGKELYRLLDLTPYSENEYRVAIKNIKDPNISDLNKALYTFIIYQTSYGCHYTGGFGFSKNPIKPEPPVFCRKIKERIPLAIERIKDCQILNRDALRIIKQLDSKLALFYLDPPYPETDQRYKTNKFTMKDFNEMTKLLTKIEGKFVLSFYFKEGMNLYDFNIHKKETRTYFQKAKGDKKRVECLATNF